MFALSASLRIYLALQPVDMRKSFDGLATWIEDRLRADPLSGQLFVFRNRAGDKLKVLLWDGQGLVLIYKRLEHGTFLWPRAGDEATLALSRSQLEALFEGVDWRSMASPRRVQLTSASCSVEGIIGTIHPCQQPVLNPSPPTFPEPSPRRIA